MDSGRNRGTRIEGKERDSYMGERQENVDGRTENGTKGQKRDRERNRGLVQVQVCDIKDKEKGRWTVTD